MICELTLAEKTNQLYEKDTIMKTKITFLIICILSLSSCKESPEQGHKNQENQPNVLFISVDDLNTMIGSMDGPALTPNLDKLAATGVSFSDAHCQSPLCGPSRASVMTGLRPSTTGIYGMIPDNDIISENPATNDLILLPAYFKKHGYLTMGIGKLFHTHAPDSLFDESGGRSPGFGPFPEERFVWDGYGTSDRDRYGKTNTDWGPFPEADSLMPDHYSVNWAIQRIERDYDKPFFMGVGFLRVHVPLYVPQKWFDLYPLETIETMPYKSDDLNDVPQIAHLLNDLPMMPSTEWAIESGEWPKIIQAYLACISFVDHEIGRLLTALENSKYADNTIIVLWSDHGYRLGEKGTFAKHALWNPATKVPLIFKGPGIPKNKVFVQPTELLSIYPTLLELCNLPPYKRIEGKSLVSAIHQNEDTQDMEVALTTFGRKNHTIKSKRFRYIQYEDGTEEFYDLQSDPYEFINLVDNPDYVDAIDQLKSFLPVTDAPWDINSSYNFQPYFVEQKSRDTNMK